MLVLELYWNMIFLYSGDIQHHLSEMKDIERNIRNMQNEMTKFNTLITKEKGIKESLEQANILMEDEFIRTLKVKNAALIFCVICFCVMVVEVRW